MDFLKCESEKTKGKKPFYVNKFLIEYPVLLILNYVLTYCSLTTKFDILCKSFIIDLSQPNLTLVMFHPRGLVVSSGATNRPVRQL